MDDRIAIVIPAYKAKYFEDTLESISKQTAKNFHVYVGDDNSPENISHIVLKYKNKIPLTYCKFKENLGGKDLVKHWERCLDLINDEKYFILFSDDDRMSDDYIEQLNRAIIQYPNDDVFHFRLNICDKDGIVNPEKSVSGIYADKISSKDFFLSLFSRKITARIPDFAFKTASFKGFVNFPRAMRSDNATVIKSAKENGIRQIGGNLYWRESDINISSNLIYEKSKCYELILTNYSYLHWVQKELEESLIPQKQIYKNSFVNNIGLSIGLTDRIKAYKELNISISHQLFIEANLNYLRLRIFAGKIKRSIG